MVGLRVDGLIFGAASASGPRLDQNELTQDPMLHSDEGVDDVEFLHEGGDHWVF